MGTENESSVFLENISLQLEPIASHLIKANIRINNDITQKIHKQTLKLYQKQKYLSGFKKEHIPITYLESNFNHEIENSLKNFIFKHMIIDFLMDEIRNNKITVANYPRLTDIQKDDTYNLTFLFNISVAEPIELKEWKNFAFRAPKRKKYKDLDKQVALFIKRETIGLKKRPINVVEEGDWVCCDATLINHDHIPIIENHKNTFWLKINNKYVKKPFQISLVGKAIGETFISNNLPLKNEFSTETKENNHLYLITIKKITKGTHFWLDSFKSNFKLKSKAEVHKKLIEVFSYRNDLSQRKAIIEELFHLLLSKHRFEVPKHFVIRRQEDILNSLKQHPDYQVYKLQKDFDSHVELLAEKQLKEEIIIDQIGYKENIKADNKDVQNYLHLFNNNRLKEFVYFKPLIERIEETDFPLQTGLLKQAVLREKTLNHMIHVLTK